MREYERILKQNNGVMDRIDYGKMENHINRMGVAWRDISSLQEDQSSLCSQVRWLGEPSLRSQTHREE